MRNHNVTMPYRKIPWKQRETFTFHFVDGTKMTIRPGEDGVTDVWIKDCHASDDAEVYNNIKNARPEPTAEEKAQRKEWEEAHTGEKADKNWNISLDSFTSSDDGESTADRHAELVDTRVHIPVKGEPADVERLCEVIAGLPQRQQDVYRLVWQERYSNVDAAAELGVSEGTVRKDRKKIIAAIAGDKVLQDIARKTRIAPGSSAGV